MRSNTVRIFPAENQESTMVGGESSIYSVPQLTLVGSEKDRMEYIILLKFMLFHELQGIH